MKDKLSVGEILLLGTGFAIPIYYVLSVLYTDSGPGLGMMVALSGVCAVFYAILLLLVLICLAFTKKFRNSTDGGLAVSYLVFFIHLVVCFIIGYFRFR